MPEKICWDCHEPKEADEFYKCSVTKDGLQGQCKLCRARYKEANRAVEAESLRRRRKADPERFRKKERERRKSNPHYRLSQSLRSRLSQAVKKNAGAKKSAPTFDLIGCSMCWLEVRLESLFKPGMSWENYGPVWHIDHIKPCAKFDLTDPGQQKICFHWTNLQPLFASDNIRKSDTYG